MLLSHPRQLHVNGYVGGRHRPTAARPLERCNVLAFYRDAEGDVGRNALFGRLSPTASSLALTHARSKTTRICGDGRGPLLSFTHAPLSYPRSPPAHRQPCQYRSACRWMHVVLRSRAGGLRPFEGDGASPRCCPKDRSSSTRFGTPAPLQ